MMPKIGFLGIHGLPEPGIPPSSQLDPIRTALASDPRIVDRDPGFQWCDGTASSLRDAVTRFRDGTFGAIFLPTIDRAIRPVPTDGTLLVVAFSGGGYLAYRWLVEHPVDSERLAVVTIAAPYRCRAGGFRFRPTQKNPFPFNDRTLKARDIAAGLMPGRLLVLLAAGDTTAVADDAAFDADDEGGAALIEGGVVLQHTIPGVDHQAICSNDETHRRIRDFVARL